MLRIAWQTLRARRGSVAGSFIAILLAVTLGYATGQLMAGALGDPGPGRFAAADAVVRADTTIILESDDEPVDLSPAPRLPTSEVGRVAAVPGVAQAVGDVAVPVGATDAAGDRLGGSGIDRLVAHGWSSARLTPYELNAGHPPSGPRQVVADARLGVAVGSTVRIVGPASAAVYRVSGVADPAAARDTGEGALFLADDCAEALSGAPGHVNAVGVIAAPGTPPGDLRDRLRDELGSSVNVLGPGSATTADAGGPRTSERVALVSIFGVMGGLSGTVALFVVAGTFGLVIAQRRREMAVLRALGATARQVRRLLAAEALIISVAAGVLGILAGGPLAGAIAGAMADQGTTPRDFGPGDSWIPLVAAFGGGILIAQLAVVAAAWRAGRIPAGDALREAAIEHARPGLVRVLTGLLAIGGGVALALIFSGTYAIAFATLAGILLAMGAALLGPWLLGLPAAAVALPGRLLGAPAMLASANLSANRWRSAALAAPMVLIVMLVGIQGVLLTSDRDHVRGVTADRVTADQVVVARDGAPLPAGTAERIGRLPGVEGTAATLSTEVVLTESGRDNDGEAWPAVGLRTTGAAALDLGVTEGSLGDVAGDAIAVSRLLAVPAGLHVGDVVAARMADGATARLRIAAVYDRSAGFGDIVLDPSLAREHAAAPADDAVFVAGDPSAGRALTRDADGRPGLAVLSRPEYLDTLDAAHQEQAWAVWIIIGLAAMFATLSLVNTAIMTTSERRTELATIRLLGGTAGQAARMVLLEMLPAILSAVAVGALIVAASVSGVPDGIDGIPLSVPLTLVAAVVGGAIALGLVAGAISARLARRTPPSAAMRLGG